MSTDAGLAFSAGNTADSRCGWYPHARYVASPNRDARPARAVVELLVIHNISLPPGRFSGDAIERLFTNRLDPLEHPYFAGLEGVRVSAHFLIRRNGELLQFVSCAERAWHAGVSIWRRRVRCNDFSVGIEVEGTDTRLFTNRQYLRLARLSRWLLDAYPTIVGVAGHDEIAPGRKTDPGRSFDWNRFMRDAGLAPELRDLQI